jgi:AcrR family transcriptional regulator
MAKARPHKNSSRRRGAKPGVKPEDRALRAALDLIAEDGWRSFTVDSVAKRAGLAPDAAREIFPSRAAVLDAVFRQVDAAMAAEGTYASDDPNPVRDRLFDVLMRRFDALNARRAAMVRLTRELPLDPPSAARAACRLARSLGSVLRTAGLAARGPLGAVQTKGLGLVYLFAVRAWLDDDSADLSATMAALDKGLRAAESLMSALVGLAAKAPAKAPGKTQARPERKPSRN